MKIERKKHKNFKIRKKSEQNADKSCKFAKKNIKTCKIIELAMLHHLLDFRAAA